MKYIPQFNNTIGVIFFKLKLSYVNPSSIRDSSSPVTRDCNVSSFVSLTADSYNLYSALVTGSNSAVLAQLATYVKRKIRKITHTIIYITKIPK
jgi:hypothetical protein